MAEPRTGVTVDVERGQRLEAVPEREIAALQRLEGAVNDEYDSGCAQALERSERDAQARLDPESLVVGGLPVDLVVTPPVLVGHERREGARRERHRHRQVDQQHTARGAARDGAGEPRGP